MMTNDDLKRTALRNARCGAIGFLAAIGLIIIAFLTHRWLLLALYIAILVGIGSLTHMNYRIYDDIRRGEVRWRKK